MIENVRVPAVPVPLVDVILGNFCICRYLRTTGTVLIQNSTAEPEPKQNLSNTVVNIWIFRMPFDSLVDRKYFKLFFDIITDSLTKMVR